jgi:hypothetical protein
VAEAAMVEMRATPRAAPICWLTLFMPPAVRLDRIEAIEAPLAAEAMSLDQAIALVDDELPIEVDAF